MSPNVGNFVHDLVEMAKAMETLPQVQEELAEVKRRLNDREAHNAALESNIIGYKQQIEELHGRIRSLEVERDDASFRVLEAEDKAHVALRMAQSIASAVGNVITTLDPPKPQPEPVVEQPQPQVQSEVPPTSSTGSSQGSEPAQGSSSSVSLPPDWKQDQAETSTLPPQQSSTNQGQGEVNPISTTTDHQLQSATSVTENVSTQKETYGTTYSNPFGPYTAKLYYDYPTYVSRWDWITGGGTDESYDWRPSVGAPA